MALTQVIANQLYSGIYTCSGGVTLIRIDADLKALSPLGVNQYYDISWSFGYDARDSGNDIPAEYVQSTGEMVPLFGWYRVLYREVEMYRARLTAIEQGLPKVSGVVYPGINPPIPGKYQVIGSGAAISVRNIGSDRPIRGDSLEIHNLPGVGGVCDLTVVVNLNLNASNSATFYVVP